jgi:hypothetical protein
MSEWHTRGVVAAVLSALSALAGCGTSDNAAANTQTAAHDSAASIETPVARAPLTIDSAGTQVLEVWPLAIAPGRQLDETRRIVEHLQADLTLVRGFDSAALLASGDGSALVLIVAFRDGAAADRTTASLTDWLRVERDTTVRRRRMGSATMRVQVRRTVGTPPTLADAAMLQFTRYALKPGHSFGALAALADSNLAVRVVQDTSAQGGATLAAADSGALYMMLQARNAAALDPNILPSGPLPFWAPFAERDEQLLAVVAVIRHR